MSDTPPRTKGVQILRKLTIGIVVLLGIVAIGYFVSPADEEAELFSAPDERRAWGQEDWEKLVSPVPDADPFDARFHTAILGISEGPHPRSPGKTQIGIRVTPPERAFTPARPEFVEIAGDKPVKIGESGTFKLEVISGGTIASDRWIPDRQHYMRIDHFDPDLQPLSHEEALERAPRMELDSSYVSRKEPASMVSFQGTLDGVENALWNLRGIFDRRTRLKVNSGGSWHNSEERLSMGAKVHLVHSTPIRAVVDLAYGPTIDVDVKPKVGAEAAGPLFTMKIIAVVPGKKTSWGSSGSAEDVKLHFGVKKGTEDEAVSFVVLLEPAIYDDSIQYWAIDTDGTAHIASGSGGAGNFQLLSTNAPPSTIVTLRASYRTKLARLLIDFPGVPGVPPENASPGNLFDVRIPQVEIGHENDLRETIARTVQFRQGIGGMTKFGRGDPPFPMVLENTTPRALVEKYRQLRPDLEIVVDPKAHRISFTDPPAASGPKPGFLEWLRRIF